MLLTTCTNKTNPPSKPSVFPTICTGRVQRQPRRTPSPKMPNRAAIIQEIRKVKIMVNLEAIGVCLEKTGDPKKTVNIGINSSSTVRPQSKATAIPIPLGAGSFSALFSVELVCSVSFKAVSLSCSCFTHSPPAAASVKCCGSRWLGRREPQHFTIFILFVRVLGRPGQCDWR